MSSVATVEGPEPVKVDSPWSITKATSWASLPSEVRQMILSIVSSPTSERRHSGPSPPKIAHFATVCREWQVFFESCIFRRLVLDPDALDNFETVVRRQDARLGYIRKLWLRIRLPKYECPDCDEPEGEATQECNDAIFTRCLQTLLGTLKLWDPARHGSEGLALMLSASSPSDTEHRFERCEIKDSYPFHYAEDLDRTPGIADFHRMNVADAFSRHSHRGCSPPLFGGHLTRVQGSPLCLELLKEEQGRLISQDKCLPAVPIVKGMVMRRQFRREIQVRTLSRLLRRSFVALEWFRLERTIPPQPYRRICFDQGFQSHLLPSLPQTLRQFSFTQWEVPKIERDDCVWGVCFKAFPHAQAYLPREMAKLSQRLERFCPPWQMDSAAFLQSIIKLREEFPKTPESPLKHLSLHCSLSSSDKSSQEFGSLAMLAAKSALSLPQLKVMELWGTCLDGHESRAYLFRYSHEDGRASIVWRSSGEGMVAQTRVIAKWSQVAQKYSHSTLVYKYIPFVETKAEIFKSDGTCIYRHLMLKDLIFDPITQTILENEPYDWHVDEHSDSLQQGNPLNPVIASLLHLDGTPLMDSLGSVNTSLASMQAKIVALETEIDTILTGFASLQAEIVAFETELDTVLTGLASLQAEIVAFEIELDTILQEYHG